MGYEIPKPTQVGIKYNMPGGGLETVFEADLPPEALRSIR